MPLALNTAAMNTYAAMTEEQKQAVLARTRRARSKMEMKQIVDGIRKTNRESD